MKSRISHFAFLSIAAAVISASLPAFSQTAHSIPPPAASAPQSPFAGTVVEDIIVRVNDQIISIADYDRQEQELEATAKQQNWGAQQIEDQKKNLLRDLVDQQLLLSKGKELGITGETEMVKQLDAIRKQNNLDSMEALEAAAKQQGVSFEDFKQHIRDRIITQQVIGQQVYRKVNITQGDIQRYYDAHKAEFDKPESVRLSEILVPTAAAAAGTDDAAQVAAAKAKADAVYAQLQGGAKFEDLAKTASGGTTAAQGGDIGEWKRGKLAKVLEDQTFALKAGEYTKPIQTRQGFIIFEVTTHTPGGLAPMKDVLPQIEEALGAERTEPALRAYLKQLREEAYIDYKPGYIDTAAVVNPSKPVYSAYAPPAVKKKRKVERTRFRQRAHGSEPIQQKASTAAPAAAPTPAAPATPSLADAPGAATASGSAAPSGMAADNSAAAANAAMGQVGAPGSAAEGQVGVSNPPATAAAATAPAQQSKKRLTKNTQVASSASQKPGKKEKIRYGQAPTKTLPSTAETQTVDAGANGASVTSSDTARTNDTARNGMAADTQVASNGDAPSLTDTTAAEKKSRFSDRAKLPKDKKAKEPKIDPFAPPPITSQEVADRQTQSAPLGLAGDTAKSKKVKPTEKTRMQDQLKNKPADGTTDGTDSPAPVAAPATAPTTAPATDPQTIPPAAAPKP